MSARVSVGLMVGFLLLVTAYLLIRWAVHPDAWEQSCIDRGGTIDTMHITFEGGRQDAQDWQVCVVNDQPQDTRRI
jgi:hypothetical protein